MIQLGDVATEMNTALGSTDKSLKFRPKGGRRTHYPVPISGYFAIISISLCFTFRET